MTLREMIDKRRSCRSYTGVPVDAETMEKILSLEMKPLYPQIKVRMDIVSREKVRCICPWTTPQLIAIYSEEAEGYLENVGFLFQQMDLHLQSMGLGACWLGMGKMSPHYAPEAEGMKFVILLAFGYPKGEFLRTDIQEFKRKRPNQIADREDPMLEPARLAPSSINSQPWYFLHDGNVIHAYCTRRGVAGYMNRIDMGIALAHLYVAHEGSFRFFTVEQVPELSGYTYTGSFTLSE